MPDKGVFLGAFFTILSSLWSAVTSLHSLCHQYACSFEHCSCESCARRCIHWTTSVPANAIRTRARWRSNRVASRPQNSMRRSHHISHQRFSNLVVRFAKLGCEGLKVNAASLTFSTGTGPISLAPPTVAPLQWASQPIVNVDSSSSKRSEVRNSILAESGCFSKAVAMRPKNCVKFAHGLCSVMGPYCVDGAGEWLRPQLTSVGRSPWLSFAPLYPDGWLRPS